MVATQASSDPKSRDRQLVFEVKKSVLAIAAHPVDASVLFQAHDDGSISAGTVNVGQKSYTSVWNVPLPGSVTSVQVNILGSFYEYITISVKLDTADLSKTSK